MDNGEIELKTGKSLDKNEEEEHVFESTSQIWRNVIIMCFGFMFLFTSFQALQALQSSLFIDEGMGTTVLACIYGAIVVSTFFVPTPLLNFLGCKWSLALAMSCYILFMVAHFYATWGLFIPTAIILGIGAAPLWTSKGQYLNIAAHDFAKKTGRTNDAAANLFFGIFFLFFQSTSIWGNIISSQILRPADGNSSLITPLSEQELGMCGHNFCPSNAQDSNNTNLNAPSTEKLYMLAGIYTGCGCAAVAIILIFLQQLPTEAGKKLKCSKDSCQPKLMVATFMQLKDYRQLLLIPLTMYSGLEQAFLASDYTQSFVTCPLGSWWVGYVMICYGVVDATCSLLFGKLVEYVGRVPFFVLGFLINISVLITLLNYETRQDSLYVYFIFSGLWGMADAVWQTQINALYGVLFKESGEAAFSNYRLWESLGFISAFIYQSRLCFPSKAYILIVMLIIGMAGYGVVEAIEYRKRRKVAKFNH